MATHSSILAWKIPWTEKPGVLQFMGSQRVGHGWVTNTFTFFRVTVDRLRRQPSSQQGWCDKGDIKPGCEHPHLRVCLCDVKQCIRISFWLLLVMDREAWRAAVHGVAKSRTWLSDWSDLIWCTPFPIWNQSVVPCLVLTVVSWPAYRFLKRQVRWSDIPISLRIFQFVVIHTVKGFGFKFWL